MKLKGKISIDKIKIPDYFTEPKEKKMVERIKFFEKYGEFKVSIILDEDNWLVDGYTSYLVAQLYGIHRVKYIRGE